MLKFAIEYACERSNACGGSFCAGSAPSTTCGWLAADTEYLLKAKKTPPVTGAASRWNVCTCVSFAGRVADLDALVGDEDAEAVAVERARLVVERVRLAVRALCVRIRALCDRRRRRDRVELGVLRAREEVRRRVDDAGSRHRRLHGLVPLPVAGGVGAVRRRVGDERRHRARADLRRGGAAELGEAEELADLAGERDLVADDRRIAADQGREAAHEDEDAVGAVRIGVGGRRRVLEVEAVVRALTRALGDDAAHGDGLADVRRCEGRAVGAVRHRSLHGADRQRDRRSRDGDGELCRSRSAAPHRRSLP